ncbi:MAG TPA: twin-arginine translocase TatA/TatE family subunit [Rhodothermales bacterium]|nr:twin-arginine translocase TatA/TatE family subunit [Bacteroidota bacterium]HRK73001.1 twin-arginine translocase TatA/TatE family subunit [Rhodothermales bacterium]HRR08328.1 twin-arginine translocase TatA/TatE family subunit [Rhodothermales bacterium]
MGNIGSTEIIVIALVIFIFFGAKRLPEIARGLGKGIGEFKKATRDIQNELNVQADDYQYQQQQSYNQAPQIQPPQPPVGQTQPRTPSAQAPRDNA